LFTTTLKKDSGDDNKSESTVDVSVVKITDILLLIFAIASLKRKKDHKEIKEIIGLILLKGLCHEMNNFLKAYYDKYVWYFL